MGEQNQNLPQWKKSPKLFWATMVFGGMMIVSLFLPWVSQSFWGASYSSSINGWGIPLVLAIGGGSIGVAFVDNHRLRGIWHIVIGIAGFILAVLLAIAIESRDHETWLTPSSSPGLGFFFFALAAAGIVIVGIMEFRRTST